MIAPPFYLPADLHKKWLYFTNLAEAIKRQEPNPWAFVCAGTMVRYASQLIEFGNFETPVFMRQYFPEAYSKFTFGHGRRDLPEQINKGIVQGLSKSLSLNPNEEKRGAISILVTHRANAGDAKHLEHVVEKSDDGFKIDAALLVLEDFVDDIKLSLDEVFRDAAVNVRMREHMDRYWRKCPPVGVVL